MKLAIIGCLVALAVTGLVVGVAFAADDSAGTASNPAGQKGAHFGKGDAVKGGFGARGGFAAKVQGAGKALDLTDEQKAKIKEIMTAAREEAKAADTPAKKIEIMKAAFEKIKTDVLTDEQKAKIADLKQGLGKGAGLGAGKGLTDDQKAKVKEILTAAREEAKAADTPAKKMEIMKAAFEKIKAEVLTDEQKAKIGDLKGRFQQGGGKGRGGFGPGRGGEGHGTKAPASGTAA